MIRIVTERGSSGLRRFEKAQLQSLLKSSPNPSFVTGPDFSRAEKRSKIDGALAPEV
jgi:hypothetical protein